MQWQHMGPPPPQLQPQQQQWGYLGQPVQPPAQFGQPPPPQQAPVQQQSDSQHLQSMLQAAQQRVPQQQHTSPPAPAPAVEEEDEEEEEQQQQAAGTVWPPAPPPPPPRGSVAAPPQQQQEHQQPVAAPQAAAGRINWADEEEGEEDGQSAEAWQSAEASYDVVAPEEQYTQPPEYVGDEAYDAGRQYEEEDDEQYGNGDGQQGYDQPGAAGMYGGHPLPSQHHAFAEARAGPAQQHGFAQKPRKQQGWKLNKRATRKAAGAAGYEGQPGQGAGEEEDYGEGSPVTQHQQRFKRQDRGRGFEPRGRQGGAAAPAYRPGHKGAPRPYQHYQHPNQGPRRGAPPGIPPRHLDDDYRSYPEELQAANGTHHQGGRGAGAAGRGRPARAASSSSTSEGRGGLEVAVRMLAEEVQGGQ